MDEFGFPPLEVEQATMVQDSDNAALYAAATSNNV